MAFQFQGHWITHRKREHLSEVSDESDVQAAAAFQRSRLELLATRADPAATMEIAFVRDVNNAYDAILANQRFITNNKYKESQWR